MSPLEDKIRLEILFSFTTKGLGLYFVTSVFLKIGFEMTQGIVK